MYFCILFGGLVVAGIVAGIGIHFACLPNQNSVFRIPTDEKEPTTGELKTSLTARNFYSECLSNNREGPFINFY